jgi:hypothetical protein
MPFAWFSNVAFTHTSIIFQFLNYEKTQSTCVGFQSMLKTRLLQPHRDIGAWRSLAARLLWEQEVVGSNPTAPTKIISKGYTTTLR